MDYSNRFLLIMIAGDHHLNNMKTLQSVFCQTYQNLHVLVCNDASNQFQGERLLYYFWKARAKSNLQITMAENRHASGISATVKKHLHTYACDYVMVIRAGECLAHADAVQKCVDAFIKSPQAAVVAFRVEASEKGESEAKQTLCANEENLSSKKLPDSMFAYRANELQELLTQDNTHNAEDTLWNMAISGQTFRHGSLEYLPDVLCRYNTSNAEEEITTQDCKVSNTKKLKILCDKVFSRLRHKRKLMVWLFKQSRFRNLLIYLIIALQLLICALLFLKLIPGIGCIIGILFTITAALTFVWCTGLVLFNLYFRKYPERLLTEDD